ncbi:MAG: DM13 domain-containing protein [Pseudomonadota bacterium]
MTDQTRRRFLSSLALAGAGTLAACATPAPRQTAKPAAPVVAANARTTARGTFEGRSNHVTTGHARVVASEGTFVIELEEDFFFDGAPDPKVALGRGGYDPNAVLAPLGANTGRQTYALKAGLDIGNYDQVWIWCERFNVPLGVADLTLV